MELINSIYWPASLLSALAAFIFGWIYFSPWVFGKYWALIRGINLKEQPSIVKLAFAYLSCLIFAVGLQLAFQMGQVRNLVEALQVSSLIVLFFIFPSLFSSKLWNKEPIAYFLGKVIYHLLLASIVAIVTLFVGQ